MYVYLKILKNIYPQSLKLKRKINLFIYTWGWMFHSQNSRAFSQWYNLFWKVSPSNYLFFWKNLWILNNIICLMPRIEQVEWAALFGDYFPDEKYSQCDSSLSWPSWGDIWSDNYLSMKVNFNLEYSVKIAEHVLLFSTANPWLNVLCLNKQMYHLK